MGWEDAKKYPKDHLWQAKAQYFCQMLDLPPSEYLNVYRFTQIIAQGRIVFKDCAFFDHNGIKYTHILYTYPAGSPPEYCEGINSVLYIFMRRHSKKLVMTEFKLNETDYGRAMNNFLEDTKLEDQWDRLRDLALAPAVNPVQEAALRMVFFSKTLSGAAEEHNEAYTLIARALRGIATGPHRQFVKKGMDLPDYREHC